MNEPKMPSDAAELRAEVEMLRLAPCEDCGSRQPCGHHIIHERSVAAIQRDGGEGSAEWCEVCEEQIGPLRAGNRKLSAENARLREDIEVWRDALRKIQGKISTGAQGRRARLPMKRVWTRPPKGKEPTMPDNVKRLQRYTRSGYAVDCGRYRNWGDLSLQVRAADVAPLEERLAAQEEACQWLVGQYDEAKEENAELRAERSEFHESVDILAGCYPSSDGYAEWVVLEIQDLRRGYDNLETENAELRAENERLRIVDEEAGGGHKTYDELAIEGAGLKSQNARLVALLREYTDGFDGMPDEKVEALLIGRSCDRAYADREFRRRALLAEIDGGGA